MQIMSSQPKSKSTDSLLNLMSNRSGINFVFHVLAHNQMSNRKHVKMVLFLILLSKQKPEDNTTNKCNDLSISSVTSLSSTRGGVTYSHTSIIPNQIWIRTNGNKSLTKSCGNSTGK